MRIGVSYLSSNTTELECIKKINQTDADYLHVDLMDGQFVENKNYQIDTLIELLKASEKPLDIHFMTLNPDKDIQKIMELNPECITFHFEAVENIKGMISLIKGYATKVGISLKPETDLEAIKPLLNDLDLVLVMSVEPGMGGQAFILDSVERIKTLKQWQKEYNFKINVDGGINDETIELLKVVKPDQIVSGSFVCKSENYQSQINKLR